jgi:hypothetical protein
MTDITIPPAALEAGARAIEKSLRTARITLESEDGYKPEARAAFRAMLEAWPGMTFHQQDINAEYSYFVLPLPQEASDDK